MAVKPEEAKAALVEKAIAQVRERLAEPQASEVERFVRLYSADAAPEDLGELDLYGAALAHWHLVQRRRPGELKVHVYTPTLEEHGWQSTHSVVEIVTDDMPFLVDSISMALTGRGIAIHNFVHPVLEVRRDEEGRLVAFGADAGGAVCEALIQYTRPLMKVPVPSVTMNGSISNSVTIAPLTNPAASPVATATPIAKTMGQWWFTFKIAISIVAIVMIEAIDRS